MDQLLDLPNIVFASSIISVSWVFMRFYPKEINPIAGYRTRRSMASKEAWLFANSHCSKLLFRGAILTLAIQIALNLLFPERTALMSSALFWIGVLFFSIIKTEYALKKNSPGNF